MERLSQKTGAGDSTSGRKQENVEMGGWLELGSSVTERGPCLALENFHCELGGGI